MKRNLLVVLVLGSLFTNCSEVKPKEQAAVIGNYDGTECGWCGGTFVWTDSTTWYRAEIPSEFRGEGKKVWIRFTNKENPGGKAGRWINITAIRER
ncbi:hypothetical protein GCM10023091_08380 [Ravibacter arvi]|uniref:Uncharacterized protein n=1 Tax=Ravibacter arvi TaxID=2051041 RepID=A0ABP8LRS1_9BACT